MFQLLNPTQIYFFRHYQKQVDNHNYYKYIVHLDGIDREFVHKELEKSGISPSGYVYEFPLHKLPVFRSYNELTLQKTERYSATHMCLPIFFLMSDEQVLFVIEMLKEIIEVKRRRVC